ncbi:MAG: NfeD family protein [Alphaproteobacteria bacterium]|nr:NfeD family protein [Alphaproteobacteria bacterium]
MEEIIAWLWMLDFWHWWAIGIALIALETFVVSTFLLWPGISALIMGFVVLAVPDMDWRIQVILFAILAVITSIGWQRWLSNNPTKSDHPNLNVRGASFIGRRVTLAEPLANGRGRMEIGDGWWTVSSQSGDDIDAGVDVEVVDSDGGTLTIKPVSAATN